MGEFDELIEEFVTESKEHIADIEEDLIKIEADMEKVDSEVINRVFRAAHSIKGSAKFLDLTNIGDLAHRLEDVLNLIRSGKVVPTSDVATPLLQAADMLKSMFEDVAASNDMDISEHLARLQAIIDGKGSAPAASKAGAGSPAPERGVLAPFDIDDETVLGLLEKGQVYVLNLKLSRKKLDETLSELGNLGEVAAVAETGRGRHAVLFSSIMEPDMIPMALNIDAGAVTQVLPDMIRPAAEKSVPARAAAKVPPSSDAAVSTRQAPRAEPEEEPAEQPSPGHDKAAYKLHVEEETKEDNTSFITFSLENETYAVPIQAIEEIIGYQDISLLPNVPPF
ncbi:MAG: Hpt domain-containing protein, partial [Desulfomonilia bacterium]